jgi:hypothetical protein
LCGGGVARCPHARERSEPGRYVLGRIGVGSHGEAHGAVTDTINPSSVYTTVLTATGGGTCALDTQGGCTLYDATVDYTLTYTTVVGVTSSFYRTCTWVLGKATCSVPSLNLDPPT